MPELLQFLVHVAELEQAGYRVDLIDPTSGKFIQRILVPKDGSAKLVQLTVTTLGDQQKLSRIPAVSKTVRRLSTKQERRIATDIDGRAQPASGAMDHAKGDVRKHGRLRIEAKCTFANSFRLTEDVLNKIERHATIGEIPVVVVDFLDKKTNKSKRAVAIVPYELWVKETNGAIDVDR